MSDLLKQEKDWCFEVGDVVKGIRGEYRNKLFEIIDFHVVSPNCKRCQSVGCVNRNKQPGYVITLFKGIGAQCPANFVLADKREEFLFRTHGSNVLVEMEDEDED